MGAISVHEFISLDGVIDAPAWTFDLFMYPTTRGAGPRLFPPEAGRSKLTLAASERYDNGVLYLAYEPER